MDRRTSRTILLVEDEAIVALEERAVLERNGFEGVVVRTGEAAVEFATGQSAFDLVLMDIDLGDGIDGTETAELILASRDVPVVFLSAHIDPEVVRRTEGITSYGYIVKHTGETVLLASIAMAFRLYVARKRELAAERARRDSDSELERYFSSSLDMLCISSKDGRFLRLNPQWERELGYPLSELEGRSFFEFLHPDDLDRTRQALAELNELNDLRRFENRYRCADGSYRWLEWGSTPIGDRIYAAAHDVTERRRREQALKEAQERLNLITDAAPVGIVITDRNDRLDYHNRRYIEMFGYTREEVPDGESWLRHAYRNPEQLAEWRRTWRAAIARATETGEEVPPMEAPVTCKDGTVKEIEFRFKTTGGSNVVVYNDITERKAHERRIERLLRERDTLFQESHHRMKNNMSIIRSLLSLRADAQPDGECASALRQAAGAVQSMAVLYDRLHSLEQSSELPSRSYFEPLVSEIVGLFSEARALTTQIDVDDVSLPAMVLSPLGIILNELVTNTIKHAYPDGRPGTIRVSLREAEGMAELTYRDDGIGLPTSDAAPDSSTGADAFGLRLVSSLVEQIGGTLSHGEGPGASYVIRFPLCP